MCHFYLHNSRAHGGPVGASPAIHSSLEVGMLNERPRSAWLLRALTMAALLLAVPATAISQESGDEKESEYPRFQFDGQFRLRTEFDGRTAGVDPDFATLSRIRIGVNGSVEDWMGGPQEALVSVDFAGLCTHDGLES